MVPGNQQLSGITLYFPQVSGMPLLLKLLSSLCNQKKKRRKKATSLVMTLLGLSNCWQLVYSPSSRLSPSLEPWGRCRGAVTLLCSLPGIAVAPWGYPWGTAPTPRAQRGRGRWCRTRSDGAVSVLLPRAGAAHSVPPAGVWVRVGSEAQFGMVISRTGAL